MDIRQIRREDKEGIRELLVQTDVFQQKEIQVAMELFDVVLADQQDYEMYTCVDEGNTILGFLCLGPTSMTNGTFDVYWLAVNPSKQRQGVGKRLLEFGEGLVHSKGGRLLVSETSSQPKYLKARTFYLHNGFRETGHIKDYYDVGDDLIIYSKYIKQ